MLSASPMAALNHFSGAGKSFHSLFDNVDAMSIQGYLADGTVVYWNRASEQIYGYSPEEALGSNLYDLIIPPDLLDVVRASVKEMFETGQGIAPGRLELRHKDGHLLPVYSSHTVVQVPGQPTVLFCMDTDIREIERTEGELRIAAVAFEAQQGMVITDAQGLILRVNQALTRATGYTADEVTGCTPEVFQSERQGTEIFREAWLAVAQTGNWQGEMWCRRKTGMTFAAWVSVNAVSDATGRVTHYVCTQTDITERKLAEARIAQLAFYDALTGLPNRQLLLDRLQQAVAECVRQPCWGALFFIDIDHFKTLNDTLGHDVGDDLLRAMAQRLNETLRKVDTAARFGGDEFVVLIEQLGPSAAEAAPRAQLVGEKILQALSQPVRLGDHHYQGSASMGVTLFSSQACGVDDLLKQADLALYEAKAAGRNTLRFFDPEMQAAVTQRALTVAGLREALLRKQFLLYFQPQVDTHGRVCGAEALVRWDRPGIGIVQPGEFILIAEEAGLIVPLGRWVLEAACQQLAHWAKDKRTRDLTLAVNVSAGQFRRSEFIDHVVAAIQGAAVDPGKLKLELTESLLVEDLDGVVAKMAALKALGIGLALDDFGTGYSSLAYLRRLPLDELKVDRSFVRDVLVDPKSAAIARTIVVLGQTLGLQVIAEGVETVGQRELLVEMGCQAYQGYLFSRPLPLLAFERFVEAAWCEGDAPKNSAKPTD